MLTSDKLSGETVGKYLIGELFGEGGMAYVYKGIHADLGLPIAFKVLFPELARQQEVRDRFKREARLQFRLQHPNVVRVIDLIDQDGLLGMVMDWVQGQDMSDYLKAYGRPLPPNDIKRLFLPVLSAVGHAHDHHIIHRDLKPANILLEGSPGKEVPKVMDFGIAKSLNDDNSKTKTGLVMGTPYYLAPEQARGAKNIDHRADIYSLGVTLYQMLTAQLPFDGDSAIAIITAHCMEPIPALGNVLPGIDPQLDMLIQKALAKDPNRRFSSCQEFADELSRVLPDQIDANWSHAIQASTPNLATGVPMETSMETAISSDDTMQFSGDEKELKKLRTSPTIRHNASSSPNIGQHTRAEAPAATQVSHPDATAAQTHFPILEEEEKKQPMILILSVIIGVLVLGIAALLYIRSQGDDPNKITVVRNGTPNKTRTPPERSPPTRPVERRPAKVLQKVALRVQPKARPNVERRPAPAPVVRVRAKTIKRQTARRASASRWSRSRYKRCNACVKRAFRRLRISAMPGMNPSSGLCNFGDFVSIGNKCARSCGRQYLYYCVSYLNQSFRSSRGPHRASAGLIPRCKSYVSEKALRRKLRRRYRSSAMSNSIVSKCRSRWRKLGR